MRKYILLISILMFTVFAANAQNAGEYYKNNEIDKFVGTWEWKSGNDYFRIVISKQKLEGTNFSTGSKHHRDMAIGWHIYVKNGVIIDSSMDNVNRTFVDALDAIRNSSLNGGGGTNSKYLLVSFSDKQKNKSGKATLTLVQGKSNEANWKLKEREGIMIYDPATDPPYPQGWTVPTELVMKKISDTDGGIQLPQLPPPIL